MADARADVHRRTVGRRRRRRPLRHRRPRHRRGAGHRPGRGRRGRRPGRAGGPPGLRRRHVGHRGGRAGPGRPALQIAASSGASTDELAGLEIRDCGKPSRTPCGDIEESAFMFEYYAGWATKISGDIPPVGPDAMSLIVKEPVGVCGLIVPWNYPMLMAAQKVAPALAAGCTVVLKPAEQTPLTALGLAPGRGRGGRAGRRAQRASPASAPEAGQPAARRTRGSTRSASPAPRRSGSTIMRTCADSAEAGHPRTRRQEPQHRVRRRRPGRGRSPARAWGSSATRARCARRAVGSSSNGPSTTRCWPGWSTRPRRSRSARASTRTTTMGPLVSAAAARPGAGLHRLAATTEGANAGLRRREPDRPGPGRRLLRAAHHLRGRPPRPAHRPRGDLRPGR